MNSRLLLTAFAALFCAALIECAASEDSPPNIIFVMADDLGYGDPGCYGGRQIATPHIDRMAAEGVRFTQCYAGSTVCAPSRSVLMTGLHTGHTRVRGNFGVATVDGRSVPKSRIPLLDSDVTVAEVLKDAGYATGMTGKWGLGEPGTSGVPTKQGFDSWFGFLNQRRAHNHYPEYLWLGDSRFPLVGNVDGKQQLYSHDLFTGYALNFIRSNHAKPFFLYLPYCVPHNHFQVPDLGEYADRPWSDQEKEYAAMVTRMDQHLGQIFDLLTELKIDSNTIVFFCSDNGAANRYEGTLDSSGPLRGRKRDMYEGGLRTPMVVRWPGKIPAGKVSDVVWSFADFLPTATDLAGTKSPAGLDGVSVLPALLGRSQQLEDRFLYWEFFEKGFQQAARHRNFKAIRLAPGEPLELYDLVTDVAETNNIAASHPEVVAKFENHFQVARTESAEFQVNMSTAKVTGGKQ